MKLTNNNPYILQAMEDQELSGQQAQMQNIAAQQAQQAQAMAQQQQLSQAAGQQAPSATPNLALASALRKDKKKEEELANREASQWNLRPSMEYYSKGLNPMNIISDQ